jgi:hypothetical protein
MPIARRLLYCALLVAAAPAGLEGQDRDEELRRRVDSLLDHPHAFRLFIDSLVRASRSAGKLECPMPVARPGGGAALRLRLPPDTARGRTRPVPMPTVPPGCVNPLFRKP